MQEFYNIVQAATDEQRHVLGELILSTCKRLATTQN